VYESVCVCETAAARIREQVSRRVDRPRGHPTPGAEFWIELNSGPARAASPIPEVDKLVNFPTFNMDVHFTGAWDVRSEEAGRTLEESRAGRS